MLELSSEQFKTAIRESLCLPNGSTSRPSRGSCGFLFARIVVTDHAKLPSSPRLLHGLTMSCQSIASRGETEGGHKPSSVGEESRKHGETSAPRWLSRIENPGRKPRTADENIHPGNSTLPLCSSRASHADPIRPQGRLPWGGEVDITGDHYRLIARCSAGRVDRERARSSYKGAALKRLFEMAEAM